MSVFEYKKYKISLSPDSNKTQGLRAGDIVRRQYVDGKSSFYSLMCVLDSGVDKMVDEDNEIKELPYFIAALLEGDAPQTSEILDFARITSLFDVNRLGALYLTASDSNAPYMDVIDGIGKNKSLCWPESVGSEGYTDPQSQYIISGRSYVSVDYIKSETDIYRICHFTKNSTSYNGFIGISQDFYQYIENPQRVLISYKIKSNRALNNIQGSLGYTNGERTDGEFTISSDITWKYKFHAITIDWSGRHLRTFKLDLNDNLEAGDEVWISDLNIILLSSVSSFQESSHVRIGKMDGINDKVFGKLNGYGGYLQKLYASNSANISGTLTAGDENGFASTFYAGKIHKNAFINSVDVSFQSDVEIDSEILNPTGIGNVYKLQNQTTFNVQTSDWLHSKKGEKYCFSFWAYLKNTSTIYVMQNGTVVGTIVVDESETHQWVRHHVVFNICEPYYESDDMFITIASEFGVLNDDEDENVIYFTAPQLERGENVSQYQPTDEILSMVEDYGAWFSRGGIGGTIQNPLLQLNYNGDGSIGTRTKSFLLRQDGSGYFANKNIEWDKNGDVVFGSGVTLNWENFNDDAKYEIASKSVKLVGGNLFSATANSITGDITYSPSKIKLTISAETIDLSKSTISWHYLSPAGSYVKIPDVSTSTFTVNPIGDYWSNDSACNIKCVVMFNQNEYTDTILIQKSVSKGYEVVITSSNGSVFRNGKFSTILKADVYYNGVLIPEEEAIDTFGFIWKRYDSSDNEINDWPLGSEIEKNTVLLDYDANNVEKYSCEITLEISSLVLGRGKLGKDTLN